MKNEVAFYRGEKEIDSAAGLAIIFRAQNPSQLFLEIKDDGYPLKAFCRHLYPFGGSWEPQDGNQVIIALRREWEEEIGIGKILLTCRPEDILGTASGVPAIEMSKSSCQTDEKDLKILKELKEKISASFTLFGNYLCEIPYELLELYDPGKFEKGITAAHSYWTAAIQEKDWQALCMLQEKYNLSTESISIITSVDEIFRREGQMGVGHEVAFMDFLKAHGLATKAQKLKAAGTGTLSTKLY